MSQDVVVMLTTLLLPPLDWRRCPWLCPRRAQSPLLPLERELALAVLLFAGTLELFAGILELFAGTLEERISL